MSSPPEPSAVPQSRGPSAVAGCLLALLAAALGFACVWTALVLGTRGELAWKVGQPTEVRLWLVQGEGLAGVGWSRAQVVERRAQVVCVIPRVTFFTWRGEAPAAALGTCECYRQEGRIWAVEGPCAP